MTRRTWDSKTKARIILEALKGRPINALCAEHGISQGMYYKWRDTFMENMNQPFEVGSKSRQEARLVAENRKLKEVIGDLTIELKKNDW